MNTDANIIKIFDHTADCGNLMFATDSMTSTGFEGPCAIKGRENPAKAHFTRHRRRSFAFKMLPTETFVDVVSFLGFYDLGGLKLAANMPSALAEQCAKGIRLFDFSDLSFHLYDSRMDVCQVGSGGELSPPICSFDLSEEENLSEFVSEAFRNCIVGRLVLLNSCQEVLTALSAVADTIDVDKMLVSAECFRAFHELVQFLDSLRRVQVRVAKWVICLARGVLNKGPRTRKGAHQEGTVQKLYYANKVISDRLSPF